MTLTEEMSSTESDAAIFLGQVSRPAAPPRASLASAAVGRVRARRSTLTILGYLVVAVPICFLGLGSTDVVTMEGIVADGARHMERTGDYAVPRLHGEIYSYKPPLAYWMALASFRLFGAESEWTLRFPFALSGRLSAGDGRFSATTPRRMTRFDHESQILRCASDPRKLSDPAKDFTRPILTIPMDP